MTLWITPTLVVDADWPEEDLLDADEATTWIQEADGTMYTNVAHVRDEATARQVLDNLGCSTEEIDDRLHFAKTGEVLFPL